MKRKLVFATNNAHKLEEVREVVKDNFEILSLKDIGCNEDIEETGTTLIDNALIKVRYVKEKYGYDCFGDDTGLEVEALNGAPGVFSARYAGDGHDAKANMKKLLKELDGETNRKACFRTVIALILNGEEHLFEGRIDGDILTEEHGTAGFGYDPVFRPDGYTQTFAELGLDIKNEISHRALAVKKLCDFLSKL
ncbi:non-canonical purine NTP pyrophosphatase [Bacteroidia bacterium]|nr:non-canonical purine NTP pyrophosphatase [Bacteroidia bacterium]GHV38576.1 non-canonical purine NTP pyrophosphatase [Bacteroidia bacterium]